MHRASLNLESIEAAARNAKAAGKEFDQEFGDLLAWVEEHLQQIKAMEPISADSNKLQQQTEELTVCVLPLTICYYSVFVILARL